MPSTESRDVLDVRRSVGSHMCAQSVARRATSVQLVRIDGLRHL